MQNPASLSVIILVVCHDLLIKIDPFLIQNPTSLSVIILVACHDQLLKIDPFLIQNPTSLSVIIFVVPLHDLLIKVDPFLIQNPTSPSVIILVVHQDQHIKSGPFLIQNPTSLSIFFTPWRTRVQELCEHGDRPGLSFPIPNKPYGFCGRKAYLIKTDPLSVQNQSSELCEHGDGPGLSFPIPFTPSLISPMASVDVKHYGRTSDPQSSGAVWTWRWAWPLIPHPIHPIPNKPYGFHHGRVRVQELCESRGGRPGLFVLTNLVISVDVKQHWTMLTQWSQLVPNMSSDIRGH